MDRSVSVMSENRQGLREHLMAYLRMQRQMPRSLYSSSMNGIQLEGTTMKAKYIKIGVSSMCLATFLVLIYIWGFKTTYSGGFYTFVDVPTWMEGDLSTDSSFTEEEPGPTIQSDEDSYAVLKIRFYDSSTQKLITDKSILRQILSMFKYTDEPFVYDEERTVDGNCFFYYNGILLTNDFSSMFSGFTGNEIMVENAAEEISGFYLKVQGSTISCDAFPNLDEALDAF